MKARALDSAPTTESQVRPDVLPRRLGAWSGAALLIGLTIGSGIFRVPSTVAGGVGSVNLILLVWVGGGLVALFGALSIAELAVMFPRAGGLYVFLKEAYGPLPAFLYGWSELLVVRPAALGALAMIFAEYAGAFVALDETATRGLAAATIVVLVAGNARSVRWGSVFQEATTAAKIIALIGLTGLLMVLGDPAGGALLAGSVSGATPTWGSIGVALVAVLWAYDGWADTTAMAGEIRNPGRNLPLALAGGTASVVAIYLAVNVAYLYVLPLDALANSSLVAADAATSVLGAVGASLVAALVMLSVVGALNGAIMTGPRILFALSRDGLFFRPIGVVHPQYGTPLLATLVTGAFGIAYVSVQSFEQLAGAFVIGVWPFYAAAVAGVLVLRRRKPLAHREYRTVGYPAVPLVFLAASVLLLLNSLVEQTNLTMFAFGVILSGVPAYFFWHLIGRNSAGRR